MDVPESSLHPRKLILAPLEDSGTHPGVFVTPLESSVAPLESILAPIESFVAPREYPKHLANTRGHPRMSPVSLRGCPKCPIPDHKAVRECPKSIREVVFDIRGSSGDVFERPGALRKGANSIREEPRTIREEPRTIRECPAGIREDPGELGDKRECSRDLKLIREYP